MVSSPLQNTQAQGVVASEGMLGTGSLMQELDRLSSTPSPKKGEVMKQLLTAGGNKDLTNQLMKELLTKVAQSGIVFEGVKPQSKVEGQTSRNKDDFQMSGDEYSDKVDLSGNRDLENPQAIKSIGKKSANIRERVAGQWQEIEEGLIKEGKSKETISRMEMQFKESQAQKELFTLLKDSALLYYLDSDTKTSKTVRRRGFAEYLEKAGKEMGKEAATQAKSELKGFVLHELENQLILRTFLRDGDFKECHKLLNVGDKVELDSLGWMEKHWPRKRADHGLDLLDVPHEVTGYVNLKDNDSDARRERQKFDYKEEDEKDVVLNRLRACYMQMALRPDASQSLLSWFKIRTLKNGLTRLGVYTKDVDEKVQAEAKTLAKMKTLEVLDEALHERASLFDPSKDKMVEGKIKNCLKNLERLGFALEDSEFVALRDKANQHMYSLVEKELADTKKKTGPEAAKKEQRLNKLLARLREESKLSFTEEA